MEISLQLLILMTILNFMDFKYLMKIFILINLTEYKKNNGLNIIILQLWFLTNLNEIYYLKK